MSDRIAAAVWVRPKRRFAVCSGALAFVIAVVAAVAVMSGASRATPSQRPLYGAAQPGLSQAQINADVNGLLAKMTGAEKFGQLTMAGPDGPNGAPGDLIAQAK